MFFQPKLKVDSDEKALVDRNFEWILERFGKAYLRPKKAIFPQRFFYQGFEGRQADFERTARSVCHIMDIDHKEIEFQLTVNDQAARSVEGFSHPAMEADGAAGLYEDRHGSVTISVEDSYLKEPIMLVAVLAHELSHYKLLHELDLEENDEHLTDMLPTFFGFGVFTSGSVNVVRSQNTFLGQSWSHKSVGYLSESVHGYLMAKWTLFSRADPKVLGKLLAPNVFDSYRSTLKVLDRWKSTSN